MRRSNNPPAAPPDQTVAERSCEKSCQVTSEQIKADMKAAAERKRCCSKEPTSRAGPGTGRAAAGPEVNDAMAAASTPLASSMEGAESSCVGASRPLPGSRRQSSGTNFSQTEDSCKARTRGTRDSQRTAASNGDGPDCGRAAGANERPSSDPSPQQRVDYFVPRRPLTRSCTRLSSVPLLPETGETKLCKIHTKQICYYSNISIYMGGQHSGESRRRIARRS